MLTRYLILTPIAVFLLVFQFNTYSFAEAGYTQTGIASWYGRRWHGKKTASGKKFNMHRHTAAHKSLPFGTKVKVTNLKNGRSVNVLITDRGPFIKNRIIDLSRAAAIELGIMRKGLGLVRIEVESYP